MDTGSLLAKGDGLVIVDVQNDFCPGGSLPIEGGHGVVPVLNDWIKEAGRESVPVYASRDWHPRRHMSFKGEGGKWPPHCIQDTDGAAFHPDLMLPEDVIIVTKGVRFDKDQNSAFDETGLAVELRHERVKRLWIGGLALDVCVFATVLDARESGFLVNLILQATRPVTPDGGRDAIIKMKELGVTIYE